jgi:hypothetical protein
MLLGFLAIPSTANAQIVHSASFGGGFFWPKGFDSRVEGDVLVANLSQPLIIVDPPTTTSLDFAIGDFAWWTFFGEYHVAFNRYIEASGGLDFYQRTVHSRYRDLVDSSAGNTDILQDLKLRQIPITGLVRFMAGRPGKIQPYGGAGITFSRFTYSEEGEFVDPVDLSIFCAGTPGCPFPRFEASGWALGPVFVGGVRLPIGGDIFAFTTEGRWTLIDGDTGGEAAGFLGDKIDLGGFSLRMSLLIRF